jgi:hypothetical protein
MPGSEWDHARWSNDGEHVSRVQHFFDAKQHITHDEQRNFETQIWRGPSSNLSARDAITAKLPGRTFSLFDMGTAGYLISGRMIEQADGDESSRRDTLFRYEKIGLDGTVTLLGEAYGHHTILWADNEDLPISFLPSPDGLEILKAVATDSQTIAFTVLNAATLETTADAQALVFDNPNLEDHEFHVRIAWTDDDAIIISDANRDPNRRNWRMAIGDAPVVVPTMNRSCFSPPTTSSGFNAAGLHIQCDSEGEVFTEDDAGFEFFGCEG